MLIAPALVALHVFAAEPTLLGAFNLADASRKLEQTSKGWKLNGPCSKKTASRVHIDEANAFLRFVARDGNGCNDDADHNFAAFKLSSGSLLYIETSNGSAESWVKAYVVDAEKLVPAPKGVLDGLPRLDALLPAGAKSTFTPVLNIVLPQHGAEVLVTLAPEHADKWCAGIADKLRPAECAADSNAPLRTGIKVKWNKRADGFSSPIGE